MSQSISKILKESSTTSRIIAEVCGVTKQTVNLWKRGSTVPPKRHLAFLSQACGIPYSSLNEARNNSVDLRKKKTTKFSKSLVSESMASSNHTEVTEAIGIELPFSYDQLMGTNTPILDSHLAVLQIASSLAEFGAVDALRCLELANEMREANRNSEKDNTDG